MQRVVVTGAGGFIGHHLVTYLKERGYWVRGVDVKLPEYTAVDADEFEIADLRVREDALRVMRGIDEVYALAADMGGMGFISSNHGTILHDNLLINLNTIEAARVHGVGRYLFSSAGLRLSGAPAGPRGRRARSTRRTPTPPSRRTRYGWEKLVTERLCLLLPRRLRPRDADRPLPQHLRAVRHLRRRAREDARGALPQDRAGRGRRDRSRSGATASRRARSATSTTASRASTG